MPSQDFEEDFSGGSAIARLTESNDIPAIIRHLTVGDFPSRLAAAVALGVHALDPQLNREVM